MLYDITKLYPGHGKHSLSQTAWDALTSRALRTHDVPLNFNSSAAGRGDPRIRRASQTDPFPPDSPLHLSGLKPLHFLGHHLFTPAGVPDFVLKRGAVNLLAKKLAAVDAPRSADKGPDGTGAVPWLQLGAKDGSVGHVKYVYRVLTAGGASHGCSGQGDDGTSYTAMYWFFG
ncbi:hypothetical protein UVI_02026940 [Ustilaginoidea virens]|nr:hypothetical protein UVI_02026940 [Ustilaginoidea virens]